MKPFDSRGYQRQIERELIFGAMAILIVVGGGLIWLFWGSGALVAALGCFGIFLALTAGLWLFFKGLEILARDKG